MTYEFSVWPDPPAENEVVGQAELISCLQSEWQQQVVDFQEAAANDQDEGDDNEGKKVTRLKFKPTPHKSKSQQKGSTLKRIDLSADDLNALLASGSGQAESKEKTGTSAEDSKEKPKEDPNEESKEDPKESRSKAKSSKSSKSSGKGKTKLPKGSGGEESPTTPLKSHKST